MVREVSTQCCHSTVYSGRQSVTALNVFLQRVFSMLSKQLSFPSPAGDFEDLHPCRPVPSVLSKRRDAVNSSRRIQRVPPGVAGRGCPFPPHLPDASVTASRRHATTVPAPSLSLLPPNPPQPQPSVFRAFPGGWGSLRQVPADCTQSTWWGGGRERHCEELSCLTSHTHLPQAHCRHRCSLNDAMHQPQEEPTGGREQQEGGAP